MIGLSLLVMMGFGVVIPALPAFARRFGVAETGVALVVFAFSLTRLVGDLFVGRVIAARGERIATAAGAIVVGASSLAAGTAGSFTQLMVFRGLGGFGSALFLGGLYAHLLSITTPAERGRAMGVFHGSFTIGLLLGPLFGGLIMKIADVNTPLYVYGVVCLLAAIVCLKTFQDPEVSVVPVERLRASALRPLFRNSAYRAALAASAVGFITVSAFHTLIPVQWVDQAGGSEASAGIPFAATGLAALFVVWHAGSVSDRRGRRFALIPGMIGLMVTTIALGLDPSTLGIVALMVVQGFAGAYIRPGPAAIVGDVAPMDLRALAVGGHRVASDIGAIVGPIIAGVLAEHVSYLAAYLAIGACCAVAAVMAYVAEETAPAMRTA